MTTSIIASAVLLALAGLGIAYGITAELKTRKRRALAALEAMLDGIERAVPPLSADLARAARALEADGPLPWWCRESLDGQWKAVQAAREELEHHTHDLRRLRARITDDDRLRQREVRPERIHALALIQPAGITATYLLAKIEVGKTQAELKKLREQAPATAKRAAEVVAGFIKSLKSQEDEGWPIGNAITNLTGFQLEAEGLQAVAADREGDPRQAVQRAAQLEELALDEHKATLTDISRMLERGQFPVPEHPLLQMCRESDIVVMDGHAYPIEGKTVLEGPLLKVLERSFLARNGRVLAERAASRVQKDLEALSVSAMSVTEQLVAFVVDKVFPHLRTPDSEIPVDGGTSTVETDRLRAVVEQHIDFLEREAAAQAPPSAAHALFDMRQCAPFLAGDPVRVNASAGRAYSISGPGSEGEVIGREGDMISVRFTRLVTQERVAPPVNYGVHEEHLEHVLPPPSKAIGGPAERALGEGRFLIRKDGSMAALTEGRDGPLTIHGRTYVLDPLGYTTHRLSQAINYWTCFCARLDGIHDALRRDAITVPAARLAAVRIVGGGKYAEGDHAVEVRDGRVYVVLDVPAYALIDRDGRHHQYPALQVSTEVRMDRNGTPQSSQSTSLEGCPFKHPFARLDGQQSSPICLNSILPDRTGDEGEFVAALIMRAKDVLRTGWKADGSGAAPIHRLHDIPENIITEEEVRRQGLPVTNAS